MRKKRAAARRVCLPGRRRRLRFPGQVEHFPSGLRGGTGNPEISSLHGFFMLFFARMFHPDGDNCRGGSLSDVLPEPVRELSRAAAFVKRQHPSVCLIY